jgi:hypothetical protein
MLNETTEVHRKACQGYIFESSRHAKSINCPLAVVCAQVFQVRWEELAIKLRHTRLLRNHEIVSEKNPCLILAVLQNDIVVALTCSFKLNVYKYYICGLLQLLLSYRR